MSDSFGSQARRREGSTNFDVSVLELDLPSLAGEVNIKASDLQDLISSSNADQAMHVPSSVGQESTRITPMQVVDEGSEDLHEGSALLRATRAHKHYPPSDIESEDHTDNLSIDLSTLFPRDEGDNNSQMSFGSHLSMGGASMFTASTRQSIIEDLVHEMPVSASLNFPQILMVLDHAEQTPNVEMYLAVAEQPCTTKEDEAGQTILDALHVPLALPQLPDLPTDIDNVTLRVEGDIKHTTFVLHVSRSVKALGYLITLFAMLSISCLGLVTKEISSSGVSETMIGLWRSTSITLCVLPLALFQFFSTPIDDMKHILKWPTISRMMSCTIGYAIWVIGFFVALGYTSVTHAYLLNTAVCIWLVGIKHFDKDAVVLPMERIGAVLAFAGILASVVGGLFTMSPDKVWKSLFGDIIAFTSAAGAVWYLRYGSELRSSMPMFLYMLPVQGITALALCAYVVMTEECTWGRSPVDGIFGWLTEEWIFYGLFLGIVTGLLGVVMYIAALRMVPAVIVSAVMLLEPPAASLMAVVGGYEHVDTATIVGGIFVLCGIGLVTVSTRKRERDIDVTEFVN
eukprot:CFRG1501T1